MKAKTADRQPAECMKRGKQRRTSTESIREKEGAGGVRERERERERERSKFGVLLCDHAATCCQGHYGGGLILVWERGGEESRMKIFSCKICSWKRLLPLLIYRNM